MFRDLKEYQEIQKIYEQNVYESSDDKFLKELFEDINTPEEAEYVLENIDYLFDLKEGDKGIGKLITGLKNSKQINKVIKYLENIGRGAKNKPKVDGTKTKEVTQKLKDIKNKIQNNPTVTGSKTNIKPNDKVTSIVKSDKKGIVKGDGTKVKGDTPKVDTKPNVSGVDKIKDAIKNNPVTTAAGAITGTVGTVLEKHLSLSKAEDALFSAGSPSYWRKYLYNNSEFIFGGSAPAGITTTGFSSGFTTCFIIISST